MEQGPKGAYSCERTVLQYSFNLFWLADELKPTVWHKMCDLLTHLLSYKWQ